MVSRVITSILVCSIALACLSGCHSHYNTRSARASQKSAKGNLTKAKSVERKGKKDRESNLKTTRKVQKEQHDNFNALTKKKVSKNKVSSTGAFLIY